MDSLGHSKWTIMSSVNWRIFLITFENSFLSISFSFCSFWVFLFLCFLSIYLNLYIVIFAISVCLFFFFPSFSLRFEQPKGGEEMQRKELVSGFVVSSLHEAPPSLPRKRLSPKSRRHSLICVCGLSLLGGGKCRNVSPPLLVERTLISLR